MGKELFDNIPSKVADILSDVKNGRVGLPDLQRPFVWKDNKVRELLDSMMKGYPIGYIMLWASPDDYENTVHIGKNEKIYKRPNDLVIDGQQRLTALLAAMYGVTIMDKNYKERAIRISFNPLTREFAVWTPAFEKNPEWISEISQVFAADEEHNISKFRKAYINGEFVDTTPKEFDLLVYMCENEKVVLKRENILDAVWGFDYDGDMRTVDTLVKQLRKKMTDKYPYITSVYGVGYRFEVK